MEGHVTCDAGCREGSVRLGAARCARGKVREDLIREVGEADADMPGDAVSRGCRDDKAFAGECTRCHAPRLDALSQSQQSDIEVAAPNGLHQRVAVADRELDRGMRMSGAEPCDRLRDRDGAARGDDTEMKGAHDAAGRGSRSVTRIVRCSDRPIRMDEECLTRLGGAYAAARSDEQPLPEFPLESSYLVAQRRLRHEAALGGARETGGRRDFDDVSQLLQIHVFMIAVHVSGENHALDSWLMGIQAERMNRLSLLLLTALAPLSWGTTYLVTTELLPTGHPLFAGLLRALPAGLVAMSIGRALPRGAWWLRSLALGTLNIGAFFPLLFIAAERLPGGVAAAVAGVQPLTILGLSTLLLGDRIRPVTAIAAAVGAGGVALVVLGPAAQLDALGILAALGGVTATSVGMILTKRWGRPAGVGAVAYAGWQLTAGGLVLLPLALFFEGTPPTVDGGAALGYVWLGSVGGLLAYILWFRGIQQLPVIAPGLLALLSPVVATLLGALVAGERFTTAQVVGVVLVLVALVGGQLTALRRPRRSSRAPEPALPARRL